MTTTETPEEEPAAPERATPYRLHRFLPLFVAGLTGAVLVGGGQYLWSRFQPDPGPSPQQFEKMVGQAILENPGWIPEAINRLQSNEVSKLLASNRQAIEAPFEGAWAGNPEGDVTLVEFFDYNCPFCRQSVEDVSRLLKEDPGLKVVFRDLPVLGPESRKFALASLSAAKQGKYLPFYEAVFSGQGSLDQAHLVQSVRAAGLKEAAVAEALHSPSLEKAVDSNLELARALGLSGTPSWVVGNEILSGAVGYQELKEAIDKARQEARSGKGEGQAVRLETPDVSTAAS